MIKNRWAFGALLSIALLSIAGAGAALSGCDSARARATAPFETAPSETAPSETAPFQGVVEHEDRVLGFELGGRVTALGARRGGAVEAGAELARLDVTLERLAAEARAADVRAAEARLSLLREGARPEELRAARAELRAAHAAEELLARNLARQAQLATQGAGTSAQVDVLTGQLAEARARREAIDQRVRLLGGGARAQEVSAAEAALEAARVGARVSEERLARHALLADRALTVLDVHADVGEIVGPGAPVVTVADVAHPYVDVFVPQGSMARVRLGARAEVRVDGQPEPLAGEVEDVGRRTEFTPRFLFSERERPNLVVRVRVRVDDPAGRLHAGLPAFVTLEGP